jgi:general secretion pathway protein B
MSFILDALRKSEHERRLETAPDIMQAPVAVPQQHVPAWAIVLMAGLAAALVAVTIYSFLQRPGAQSTDDAFSEPGLRTPETSAASPQPQPQPQPATADPVPRPGVVAVTSTPTPAPAEAANAQTQAPAIAAGEATIRDSTAVEEPAPGGSRAPSTAAGPLPTYAQAVADGLRVGSLQMQLHVHSATPASRFVVINGSRQSEGDRFAGGIRVEEIVAEGAVLSFEGRRFLLTPN